MAQSNKQSLQLQWALICHRAGLKIFPVHSITNGKCTCGKGNCASPGKHPKGKGWQEKCFKNEEAIRQYWQSDPNANYGIKTDGLFVIDVDSKNDGVESYNNILHLYLEHIKTFIVETGSGFGAKHIFFLDSDLEFKNKAKIFPGIDIRAQGGLVVGPGSIHISGRRYKTVDTGTNSSDEINIIPLPADIKDIFLAQINSKNEKNIIHHSKNNDELLNSEIIIEGSRNDFLTSYAGKLRHQGKNEFEIFNALKIKNSEICRPPLKEQELKTIAESISKYPTGGQIEWKRADLEYSIKTKKHIPIPPHLIPEYFKKYIELKSLSVGIPDIAHLVPLITIISGILGSCFKVKATKQSDYEESLNLWGLVIAPPSSRKSSAINAYSKAVRKIDDDYSSECQKFKKDKELELVKIKNQISEIKRVAGKKIQEKDAKKILELESAFALLKNELEPSWCFSTSDSTPESLALLFKYNFRGILFLKDEMAGLFEQLDKNGYETLKSLLNESWNGGKPFRITRVGRGMIDIPSMTVSVIGGVQPDVIINSFKSELRKGLGGDGFIARFQLIGIYNNSDLKEPNSDVGTLEETEKINNLFLKLHDLTKSFNVTGTFKHESLVLSYSANELFKKMHSKISAKTKTSDSTNQAYISHISKFTRLALSLAAQFHIIDKVTSSSDIFVPIDAKYMSLAIEWADYMDLQAQELYFTIRENVSAINLIARIKNQSIIDGMTVRAIYRNGWTGLSHKDDVLSAIEYISDSNWITVCTGNPNGGGQSTEVIRLHPDVIRHFGAFSTAPHDQTDNTDDWGF